MIRNDVSTDNFFCFPSISHPHVSPCFTQICSPICLKNEAIKLQVKRRYKNAKEELFEVIVAVCDSKKIIEKSSICCSPSEQNLWLFLESKSKFARHRKWVKKKCCQMIFSVKLFKSHPILGGGFKYLLFSPRTLGKWSNLTRIFFKWVGSTTNQNLFKLIVSLWILFHEPLGLVRNQHRDHLVT